MQVVGAGDGPEVVAFVARQQATAATRVSYVGNEAPGIAAELDGLSPPWLGTTRVVRSAGGAIVGAVVVEWDEDLGRAWVLGPWASSEGAAWTATASALLDAALAQPPASVTRFEMSGEVDNVRLAALAAGRGWRATEASHVLVADAAVAAAWPASVPSVSSASGWSLRPAVPGDGPTIAELHEAEFPDAYASAAQLVDGSRTALVAEAAGGRVVGYAAGEVHADGEGFVDFIAVDPAARGGGLGQALVVALSRRLLQDASLGRVCLTVQDHRRPARALYARLGFRPDGSLVAYRSWPA